MGKWFYILVVAAVLVSCSKEDRGTVEHPMPDTPQYEASSTPVGFTLGGEWNSITKAGEGEGVDRDISKIEFVEDDIFGVYAYYRPGGNAATTPNFMFNQPVQYVDTNPSPDATTLEWQYSPTKYWPNNPTDKVDFYAYYPYRSVGISPEINISTNQEQGFKLTYTGSSYLMDILAAKATDQQKPELDGGVAFNFQHILGKVVVNVDVADQDNSNIASIWMKHIIFPINTTGTFSWNGDAISWDGTQSGNFERILSGTGYNVTEGNTYKMLTIFVIPCTINSITLGTSTDGHTTNEVSPAISPIAVEAGKVTTINITISTTKINVTATVQNWAEKNIETEFTPDN